jgi:hypothetical protein
VQGCASILRIRTLMAIDLDPQKEAPVLLAASRAHAIACGNGHIVGGPIVPYGLAFDARFDPDWEIGEGWNRRASARFCA